MLNSLTRSFSLKQVMIPLTLAVSSLAMNVIPTQANEYINSLQYRKSLHQENLNTTQTNMMAYMLSNPMPSAALLASGAGLAATLSNNIDQDTKTGLQLLGVAGGLYCLQSQNQNYCSTVAYNLAQYSLKINHYQEQVNTLNQQLTLTY